MSLTSTGLADSLLEKRADREDLPQIKGASREASRTWMLVTRWLQLNPERTVEDACKRLGVDINQFKFANALAVGGING